MYRRKITKPQGLAIKYPPLRMPRRTRPYFRRGPHHRWGRRSKVLLFLHTCKKKVQFVVKPALFYLEVLCPRARSEGMGPLRNVYLHAVGIKLPQAINAVRQYTRFSAINAAGNKFIYLLLVIRWLFVRYTLVIRLRPS